MTTTICWICRENVADSEEHKFKSSDIRNIYGKRFKKDVMLYKQNQEILLTSYKDKNVKFSKLICTTCNNLKTQDADNAYSTFVKHIDNNFDNIKGQGFIDYANIFANWNLEKDNLYRYIAKQAGCRIYAFDKALLPLNLAQFILGNETNSSLKLFFIQKEGIEILNKYMQQMGDGKFVHLANGSTVLFKSDNFNCFHGWISYNWLTIHWFCGDLGKCIQTDTNSTENVLYQNLSVEGRNESINPIDWIETYNISNDKDRIEFIQIVTNRSSH